MWRRLKSKRGFAISNFSLRLGAPFNWQYHQGLFGAVAQEFHEHYTRRFERQGNHSDFMGLNYYYRYKFLVDRSTREYGTHPSFGDIYPTGISSVLAAMHAEFPGKPIFVTEFGFADSNDLRRPFWLLETIRNIMDAKRSGVPIQGVLLWTLVNNFEWELGMSQRFGLFAESELESIPNKSKKGIKSWEAWQTAMAAMRAPTEVNLSEFQRCHEVAREQYEKSGGLARRND